MQLQGDGFIVPIMGNSFNMELNAVDPPPIIDPTPGYTEHSPTPMANSNGNRCS